MNSTTTRRLLVSLMKSSLRPSSTSTGLSAGQQPSQGFIPTHQYPKVDPIALVSKDLSALVEDIHTKLDNELECHSQLGEMSKYYFDGKGKAVRPVIAMIVGHAFNVHCGVPENSDIFSKQRKVCMISEMIHTASLLHDDVLDKAETRRGKISVNHQWNSSKSVYAGDYILAVAADLMAKIRNEEVVIVLSKILADLVVGEFQQLQNKSDTSERFELYLAKTFNKTASLIAYSCKANGLLASSYLADPKEIQDNANAAYEYGRNVGIAFQLVDDILDFVSSSEMLGKPAAADLKLGLATAPVLFASKKYPELEDMIARRFNKKGDVEKAFQYVIDSDGLEKTRSLACDHCDIALNSIETLTESKYKWALASLTSNVLDRMK